MISKSSLFLINIFAPLSDTKTVSPRHNPSKTQNSSLKNNTPAYYCADKTSKHI